jgi:hypothetical protein
VRRYADAAALLGRPAFGTPGRSLVVVQTGVIGASPGLRTVGVWGVASAAEALERLEPLRGQVQGIATAGRWSQRAGLVALGPSRIAPAGLLQQTDALWHDGEHHPVDVL